jgi:hypothetical protein
LFLKNYKIEFTLDFKESESPCAYIWSKIRPFGLSAWLIAFVFRMPLERRLLRCCFAVEIMLLLLPDALEIVVLCIYILDLLGTLLICIKK